MFLNIDNVSAAILPLLTHVKNILRFGMLLMVIDKKINVFFLDIHYLYVQMLINTDTKCT